MAPTLLGGSGAPKIIWAGNTYNCPDPSSMIPTFKEEKLEHLLIDKVINKEVRGYRFLVDIGWDCLNEADTDDLGQLIQILNYLKNADNRVVSFYPHSDNDFYADVMLNSDPEIRGIGEKDKLSGHSLKLKFESRELLTTLPFGWDSPVSHSPTGWNNGGNAYDEDESTYAQSDSIAAISWSNFIELTFRGIFLCNKVRFKASGNDNNINQVDIDVYANSSWNGVYQGSYAYDTWVEKDFSSAVEGYKVRLRFYNSHGSSSYTVNLYEVDVGLF